MLHSVASAAKPLTYVANAVTMSYSSHPLSLSELMLHMLYRILDFSMPKRN
jgi:hypothetical protein